MRSHISHMAARCLAAVLLLVAPPLSQRAEAQLPPAEELIQRYVDAIGGREAALAPRSMRSTGAFELPAMGMRGDLEMAAAQPDRMFMRIEMPGFGAIMEGFDGTVAWSINPMVGPRLLDGDELTERREESNILASIRDPSTWQAVETVERAEFDGEACFQVRIVWNSGRETLDCYSEETGLLIAVSGLGQTPMGAVEVTTRMMDYTRFGDLLSPTRLVQRVMGQEQVLIIDSIEYDTVDPAIFDLPPEIRALLAEDPAAEAPAPDTRP